MYSIFDIPDANRQHLVLMLPKERLLFFWDGKKTLYKWYSPNENNNLFQLLSEIKLDIIPNNLLLVKQFALSWHNKQSKQIIPNRIVIL